jgi:glycosyltransferase involved in cell wall biosynthesis
LERSLSALVAVRNVDSTLRRTVLEMLDILPELTSRFELVVIDDCSSDATIEVADDLAAAYPQLLAVRHPVPRGRAAAIKTGLDRSLGEVVFFADEDCRLALDQVRRLWTALDRHDLVLGRPCDRGGELDGARRTARRRGGYQMGSRRVFRELADALGDQATLIARLQRSGIPWHEVKIPRGVPRRSQSRAASALPGARGTAAKSADRLLRADHPEIEPGMPKQPNYAVRLRQLAAEE